MLRILIIFAVCSIPFVAFTQEPNLRCKWIVYNPEGNVMDSLSILPGSIEVFYPGDSGIDVTYDINTGKAVFNTSRNIDSIYVCYRVFDIAFNAPYRKYPIELHDNDINYIPHYKIGPAADQREEIFSTPGLQKTGNISRGISFGNTQDVFVNSALNLQLEGKLTDDISLIAAISDQNIPFQPEGNTQQIQEFDKIYIQLRHDVGSLTAGDIVLKNKPSNFLRYYKNVQGGALDLHFEKDSTHNSYTSVGVAVSKGKFNSMTFDNFQSANKLEEGVQGPYKLKGANNERFIIVIANSEKVYLDGKLLERGFNYDYTIDYNLAEVTFTNNVVITKFSRVRVDFEYVERNYSRTTVAANHYQQVGKFDYFLNYYSQKGNKRNTGASLTLTNQQTELLTNIGDSLQNAVTSGIDTVDEFNSSQILYQETDTTVGTFTYDPIYLHSINPDSANLQIVFTDFGANGGDYVLDQTTANGRIYKWVMPDTLTGIPQGRFRPVKVLPTPKKQQMATVGMGYALSKSEHLFVEGAVSDNDINLFSELDSKDNMGYSVKTGYFNEGRDFKLLDGYSWNAMVDYEYNSQYFSAIDRFRSTDFERDWNEDASIRGDNHIINAGIGIKADPKNRFNYQVSRRIKEGDVDGIQHTGLVRKRIGRVNLAGDVFFMDSENNVNQSSWRKWRADVSYESRFFVPGYIYQVEKNKVQDAQTDSVKTSNQYYEAHTVYVQNNDTLDTKFRLDYTYREDDSPYAGDIISESVSQTSNASMRTRIGDNHELATIATYRLVQNKNLDKFTGIANPSEETVMGRVDWNSDFFERHIKTELTVSVANGRELKREFIFIRVNDGEGTHFYRGDENGNGIEDLDEFSEGVFADQKTHIKVFVPTDEFIRTFTNNFSYRFNGMMPRNWRRETGIKGILSRFSNTSSWTINKKITDDDILSRFVPFINNSDETEIISVLDNVRSTLFYNRTNPKYGLDFTYLAINQKQLLTNGFEQRSVNEYRFNSRVNFKRKFNTRLELTYGLNRNSSDFLLSKNYEIERYQIVPELAYQPKVNFRLTGNYTLAFKENVHSLNNGEGAVQNQLKLEMRWTKVSKRTVSGNISYININYKGDEASENAPVGFEILQGLKPGNNWTWNLSMVQRLSNGLQIDIGYDGRLSENSQAIHIGRMQVSALF